MISQFSIANSQASDSGPKNKRARLVCFRCHEKKIKCDLSSRDAQQCSNCLDAGCQCRRGLARRSENNAERARLPEEHSEPVVDTFVDCSLLPPVPPYEAQNGEKQQNGVLEQELLSTSPSQRRPHPSYIGSSGYMQIFSHESGGSLQEQEPQQRVVDRIPPGLQESHLDTYFEYAQVWCPIIDREAFESNSELQGSLLLRHALALCGNQIKPPLLVHASSMDHYTRAKELFYGNHEPNPLVRIIALMLFYWWSAEPPNVVSLDTTSWWTGTAIRLAQQVGLHREPALESPTLAGESLGLRRRIWWTLVRSQARERITALSQGLPCLVDHEDCNVPMPTLSDFPQPEAQSTQAALFVHWIPLCELIGRIGQMLRRRQRLEASPSAVQLARELIAWVQSLPPALHPGIKSGRTASFDRDVHGMHLTYLSCITLLHLNQDAQPLPRASIAAIVAASCTARLFQDYLLRGSVSFLAGQAGWYITIAILALLHARRLDGMTAAADADIAILRAALAAMSQTWHSAQMFEHGINKLMDPANPEMKQRVQPMVPDGPGGRSTAGSSPGMDELSAMEGVNWKDYFPYITSDTSEVVATLLGGDELGWRFPELGWTFDFPGQLGQFFTQAEDFGVSFFSF
ncbi:hypothetical protein BJY01DRAFT_255777 [Aspergillus pseudoustus]|uniref:Zn(2)-C6 fungal-type domain-containing protein n=1 Tax=Aspergillus pseudoustus TaxID=1810923 RepID=A0ABR4IHK9_9EURO